MKIVVASGGRFHTIHLAKQLLKKHMLHRLYSPACTVAERAFFDTKLCSNKIIELCEVLYEKLRLEKVYPLSKWYVWHDNWFDRWLSKQLEKEESFDLFVGWAHYILQSIPIARAKGAKIVLEMGSMHILANQKILEEEYSKHGFFSPPIDQRNIDKMLQEYEAADLIMVPSTHVLQSFVDHGVSAEKIAVVPYGTDVKHFAAYIHRPEKYRVLFVGRVGLAKGIHYLLEAWDQIGFTPDQAELHIVGPCDEIAKEYLYRRIKSDSVIWHGGLPQGALHALYRQASLFVLPSLQEGLAMVLIEAMASGVPVLATRRTGVQDLITDGKEGFVVNPCDIQALVEKISWGFDHQDALYTIGQYAAIKAQQWTWNAYADRVVQVYEQTLQPLPLGINRETDGKAINY